MDDFPGLLTRDFGLKPQGKSDPMAPPRSTSGRSSGRGSNSYFSSQSAPIFDDNDRDGGDDKLFSDVFKYSDKKPKDTWSGSSTTAGSSSFDYDSIFKDRNAKSSLPVFDKPIYDEDVFDGLPGIKSVSSETSSTGGPSLPQLNGRFASSPSLRASQSGTAAFDDLLDVFQRKESSDQTMKTTEKSTAPLFDDLLQGFGHGSSPRINRSVSESSQSHKPISNLGTASTVLDDPFAGLHSSSDIPVSSSGVFGDPLDEISKLGGTESSKIDKPGNGKEPFDDLDSLGNIGRSVPSVPSMAKVKERNTLDGIGIAETDFSATKNKFEKQTVTGVGDFQRKLQPNDLSESGESDPDIFFASVYQKTERRTATSPTHLNGSGKENQFAPKSGDVAESYEDIWLTVSEVPLLTQPTAAPPPSRPPPPRPPRMSRPVTDLPMPRKVAKENYSFASSTIPSQFPASVSSESNSVYSELEDFTTGTTRHNFDNHKDSFSEGVDTSEAAASAAAMKEAMGMAEATFRHMREKEFSIPVRSKASTLVDHEFNDAYQKELKDKQERMENEKQREREEEEREQRRLEKEREREEKEAQLRLEKAREAERDREKARQAVERATREARERAAVEARLRAEKAAVEKAANEARQRAARAAVQRVQAEARERAAAEARERAEKAATETREKADAEAREREAAMKAEAEAKLRAERASQKAEAEAKLRSERAAVERVAAEARQRAAAAAAAAASARANQQRNDNSHKDENDLESFFSSRASSAPKPRATANDPFSDTQSKGWPDATAKTSVGSSSSMRKASSTTSIVDDLSSIFGGPPSSGEFQEVEGESEERRKARMERHQRTQERAAKALAEKNQRDLQAQREQAERHRIAETIDVEIKRWAAGKEGNLRALLSTLQYALWPECGWQPVSLTDLITAASVKKVYRKATLCIHPDKVQQKGATLQQKYIAEKVFDLLKEAWNKFNSEELF